MNRLPICTALLLPLAWSCAQAPDTHAPAEPKPVAAAPAATTDPAPSPVAATHGAPNHVVRVKTVVVRPKDVPLYVTAMGTVQALTTARVHSQVDGRISQVHFKEGAMVEEGEPLMDLDLRPFRIALAQAEANLARDTALLRNSRLNRDRDRTLLTQALIARGAVTDAEALAAEAQATVAADQAAVAQAQLQLDYARIKAPISGRTGVRLVDRGNLVHAGDSNALVVITQVNPIAIISTVAEQQLGVLQRAMARGTVVAQVMSPDGRVIDASGTLNLIDNQINVSTGTLTLKSQVANNDGGLWPGQFVRSRFIVGMLRDALMVPDEAIMHADTGDFVYVLRGDNTVQATPVTLGTKAAGLTHVERGLSPRDAVVTEGQFRLHDGVQVSVAP